MTENELYLGRLYDPSQKKTTEDIFTYDPADLTTHGVVTGMTGSGKTGLCISLLEEAALQGVPALVIDPKGDLPRGESFSVDRRMFKPQHLKESWFDPRYGCTYDLHTTNTLSFQTYVPPTSGRGNDWILVIEAE